MTSQIEWIKDASGETQRCRAVDAVAAMRPASTLRRISFFVFMVLFASCVFDLSVSPLMGKLAFHSPKERISRLIFLNLSGTAHSLSWRLSLIHPAPSLRWHERWENQT
jgi:hypothetical protein